MATMEYIVEVLEKLVNTPSPSGYTREVMKLVRGSGEMGLCLQL